jgi:hypothetical protein
VNAANKAEVVDLEGQLPPFLLPPQAVFVRIDSNEKPSEGSDSSGMKRRDLKHTMKIDNLNLKEQEKGAEIEH